MNRKEVKIRAVLLMAIFFTLALVGTSPMILGHGTDGGGGSYYWDSAEAYPNIAFIASAYRTGTTLARKMIDEVFGRVDAHLERDYTAPDDGYIRIKIYYQWNWYTDWYYWVYLGTSGLKDPLGQEVSDRLTLINPGDYGGEVSEYQAYTETYMHVGYVSTYIPVSDGVTYNLQFDLTIWSSSSADKFHLIGSPTLRAIFFVKNVITFHTSIP